VALLVSAAFWAWLWGPIGLVLSAPLTVCLVVLGKYVPQLEFFDTLLGDAPALPPRLVFYQRLLARDQDEAADVIEAYARTAPPEQAYDEFLVPALVAAKRDRDQGELSEPDERFIIEAVGETAEELSAGQLSEPPVPPAAGPESARRVRLLGCPARDAADELALRMLGDLLDPDKWEVELLTPDTLSSELLARAERSRPAVICVGSLPPGGLAHTRYLCKRLRRRFPQAKIVVGLWGLRGDAESQRTALAAAGADFVATTLLETRAQLTEWHPVFLAESATPAEPRSRDKELAGQAV
jgi:hypothetical protein